MPATALVELRCIGPPLPEARTLPRFCWTVERNWTQKPTRAKRRCTWRLIRGTDDFVKYLIGAGADAKLKDSNGARPLDLAKAKGHVDVMKVLKLAS